MRSLYESILDDDDIIKKDISETPARMLVKILQLDDPSKVTCKYEIKDDQLYISGVKNRDRLFKLIVANGLFITQGSRDPQPIDVDLLNIAHFDGVQLNIETNEPLKFLPNCNNCLITYKGYRVEAFDKLDKSLFKTKGNTIQIWSAIDASRFLCDYSFISGMDFGGCNVVLFTSANLSAIKGLTARELVIQRGGKFEKDGPLFDVNTDISDYFTEKLDEFLNRNHIISLGMVDCFVQYIDWFVKKDNSYTIKLLRHDAKRVPKIKS